MNRLIPIEKHIIMYDLFADVIVSYQFCWKYGLPDLPNNVACEIHWMNIFV